MTRASFRADATPIGAARRRGVAELSLRASLNLARARCVKKKCRLACPHARVRARLVRTSEARENGAGRSNTLAARKTRTRERSRRQLFATRKFFKKTRYIRFVRARRSSHLSRRVPIKRRRASPEVPISRPSDALLSS